MIDPLLTFVIPVRNDAARLERCLASIRATSRDLPIEILVADNGSSDASADVARTSGAAVLALPGFAVAEVRNRAARSARADLLAFVDADQELDDGWTTAAIAMFDEPSVWAAGADYWAPPDGTWVQRMYDRFRAHAPGPQRTDWLPSGNLVVRRSAFERIGGFDTTLESCEDVDFCRRLRAAGGTIMESASLRSVHVGDPRSLRALFFAELWRGRDNLRVSLRERLSLRTAPSILMPLLVLLAIGLTAAGAGIWLAGGHWRWLAAGAGILGASTVGRALRLWTRIPAIERSPLAALQAWLVGAVYELARALALVSRVSHDVRRRG